MVGVVVIHTVGFALHAVQDDAFDIDLVLTQTVGTDFKLSGGGVAVAADQQNRTCAACKKAPWLGSSSKEQ